jgi:hypothetical protein
VSSDVDHDELMQAIASIESCLVPYLLETAQRIDSGDWRYINVPQALQAVEYFKRYGEVSIEEDDS